MRLILASSSPRRNALLKTLGFHYTMIEPGITEPARRGRPVERYVRDCASAKAKAVLSKIKSGESAVIISADTAVAIGSRIFGKPATREDALRMLMRLSGKTHQVFTGVAVLTDARAGKKKKTMLVFSEKTSVQFKNISRKDALSYVRTGEPMDKAGAYAIQGKGARFVKTIRGCYFNVVGLPVFKLGTALKEMGVCF